MCTQPDCGRGVGCRDLEAESGEQKSEGGDPRFGERGNDTLPEKSSAVAREWQKVARTGRARNFSARSGWATSWATFGATSAGQGEWCSHRSAGGHPMSGFAVLPRPTAAAAASYTQRSAELCLTRLPADLQERWEELHQAACVQECLLRWTEQAPIALAGLTSVRDVDAHIGQLWLQRRGDEMDEALRVLLVAIGEGGPGGELAFLVLVRRMALVVVKLAERYGVGVSSVVASLWLLAVDYPLQRRPYRIGLNLRLDLQKRVRRDEVEPQLTMELRGLGQDIDVVCRADSRQRFINAAACWDPARVLESMQPIAADPAAIRDSSLPPADVIEGLLQWAAQVVPTSDVELLSMVFAAGGPRRTPLAEVAERLGVSHQTARQRLQRAIRRLSQAVLEASQPSTAQACEWSSCRLHARFQSLQDA